MGLLSSAGKSITAGALPAIQTLIEKELATGKADAADLAQQVIGELQQTVDQTVGLTFDRVDAILSRVENLIGYAGEVAKSNKLVVTVSFELVPK